MSGGRESEHYCSDCGEPKEANEPNCGGRESGHPQEEEPVSAESNGSSARRKAAANPAAHILHNPDACADCRLREERIRALKAELAERQREITDWAIKYQKRDEVVQVVIQDWKARAEKAEAETIAAKEDAAEADAFREIAEAEVERLRTLGCSLEPVCYACASRISIALTKGGRETDECHVGREEASR